MALSKIQTLIQKLSESENVKKVVSDIQTLSNDIQKKVQTLNTEEAVRKYKDVVKKVSRAEGDLQKEVTKVIVKLKKSAADIEKNLNLYKKKAVQQRSKIEKILKAKQAGLKTKPTATRKKAVRKAAAKTAPKKAAAKRK